MASISSSCLSLIPESKPPNQWPTGQTVNLLPELLLPPQHVQRAQSLQPLSHSQPLEPARRAQSLQPLQHARPLQPLQSAQPLQFVQQAQPLEPARRAQSLQPLSHAQPLELARRAKSLQPLQHAQPHQPLQNARPLQLDQHAQPLEPARRAQSLQPLPHAQPLELARRAKSLQPLQNAQPHQPLQNARPLQLDQHAQPLEPARRARSLQPLPHAQPLEPARRAQSLQPLQHAQPLQPPQNSQLQHAQPLETARRAQSLQSLQPLQHAQPLQNAQPLQILRHAHPIQRIQLAQPLQPVQQAQPLEPSRHAQPLEPVQHARPPEPVQYAQPLQPVQPLQPLQHAQSLQPAQYAQPLKAAQHAQPLQPAQHAQPLQPAQRAQPLQPAQHAQPPEPVRHALTLQLVQQPAQHAQPLQPAQHARPLQPAQHAQPQQPAQHAQPLQPAQHAQPLPPAQRAQPLQPAQRSQPLQPAQCAQPLPPAQRAQPLQPAQRSQPLQPAQRAQPLQPAQCAQPLPPAQRAQPLQPAQTPSASSQSPASSKSTAPSQSTASLQPPASSQCPASSQFPASSIPSHRFHSFTESASFSKPSPNRAPPLNRSIRPNPQVFGHIPGVSPGQAWATRAEVSQAGVHAPYQSGISGTAQRGGAESVVLNGGYPDGDCGDIIWYMGSGGFINPYTGNRSRIMHQNQLPLNHRNLAVQQSLLSGQPIRVVRGAADTKSPWAPISGYRYDGLYTVTHSASVVDPSGLTSYRCLVWRLERIRSHSYTIPVKPGYESRALERADMAQRRSFREGQRPAQASNPSTASSQTLVPQSTSHQSIHSANNITKSQMPHVPSLNRDVQPHTNCRVSHPPQIFPEPQTSSSTSSSPHVNTNYHARGIDSAGKRGALKRLKFTTNLTSVPDLPHVLSPPGSALIASAGITAKPLPACSSLPKKASSPSAKRRRTLETPVSPPSSSQLRDRILPALSAVAQLDASSTAPLGPKHKTYSINMQSDELLSPSPSHASTVESGAVGISSPISHLEMEMIAHSEPEGPLLDREFNEITERTSSNNNGQVSRDIEPLVKPEFPEQSRSFAANSPLSVTTPLWTDEIDVKPDISTAGGISDEQITCTGPSYLQKCQLDEAGAESSSQHEDTRSAIEKYPNTKIEPFDDYTLSPFANYHSDWLDTQFPKDQLDGIPIDYDEFDHKYAVGGYELIDDIDELDGATELDSIDGFDQLDDADIFDKVDESVHAL